MKKTRTAILAVALLGGSVSMAACSSSYNDQATTSDMCAYTQGDGLQGRDALIRNIYYPGQIVQKSDYESVFYFPCNQRNLRFAPGSTDAYADDTPEKPHKLSYLQARTSTGNLVNVELTMDWTLNQSPDVLKKTTLPLFNKYNAASSDANLRNENFSTDGWTHGFLGENMVPTLEAAGRDVIFANDDSSWQDPSKKASLASDISKEFMVSFKTTTGTTSNVVCASGESSGWTGEAGKSTFNCGDVRIKILQIVPVDGSLLELQASKAKAALEKEANAAELEAAKAKYGDNAGRALADQDLAKICGQVKAVCQFTQGNAGVSLPSAPQQ